MHIRINDFAGTFPKVHPTKIPDYAAQSCLNTTVDKGILAPSKEATQSYQSNGFPYDDFISAIFFDNAGLTYKKFSNDLTSYAFSPVHESYRLYWTTEDANKKLMFCDWDMKLTGRLETDGFDYIAGMPPIDTTKVTATGAASSEVAKKILKVKETGNNSAATEALDKEISEQIAAALTAEGELEARVYAFTYINSFGDESVPAVKDIVYYVANNTDITLTIAYATNERNALKLDYGVSGIRLYRSVTDSIGGAQFLFIKEVGLDLSGSSIAIVDNVPKGSLLIGEPLATINYDPPRRNMKGLGVTEGGVGYAYTGKTICLSEPYLLYAWPRFYELSSQYDIKGMGHYDNTIVVVTTGSPMLITGVTPESMGTMSLPLYEGCVSARSMVNLNYGCMYASNNGLVLVTTNSAKLVTEDIFSAEDWQAIKPSSIHASAYKGGYLFFWQNGSQKGSGYLDLNNVGKGVMWFDDHALNTFMDDGIIQMVRQKLISGDTKSVHQSFNPEYGEANTSKIFKWRSKTFNMDTPRRLLAGQLVADSYPENAITFRVYADGVLLHESKIKSARPFRISNHSVKRDFSIEIESNVPVREVALGETMRDMIQ